MSSLSTQLQDDSLGNVLPRACPACAEENDTLLQKYSEGDWKVVSCAECDFVYLKNPPGYEALVDEYSWEKTSKEETKRRYKTRSIGAKLSKSSQWRLSLLRFSRTKVDGYFNEGNVLDIGCGSGASLLKAKGIPHGIEISRELHKISDERMKERGGYCIHAPAVEGVKAFPDNYFKGVLMHSFLEHEENPADLINGLHRILEPGGHVYVRVPNYGSLNRKVMGKKWCGFRYPDHVNYFTFDSLENMAHENGFSFKLLNPINVMVDDNLKALLIKKSAS